MTENLTTLPAWRNLQAHFDEIRDTHLRDLFATAWWIILIVFVAATGHADEDISAVFRLKSALFPARGAGPDV